MITRLYGFSTLPIDFWSRLISRFLNFSAFGSNTGYDIWEGIDIDTRREGIKLIWDDGTRVVVQVRLVFIIILIYFPSKLTITFFSLEKTILWLICTANTKAKQSRGAAPTALIILSKIWIFNLGFKSRSPLVRKEKLSLEKL